MELILKIINLLVGYHESQFNTSIYLTELQKEKDNLIFGLVNVYSSSCIWANYKYNDSLYFFKRQLIFVILGVITMMITSKIDYHLYYEKATLYHSGDADAAEPGSLRLG